MIAWMMIQKSDSIYIKLKHRLKLKEYSAGIQTHTAALQTYKLQDSRQPCGRKEGHVMGEGGGRANRSQSSVRLPAPWPVPNGGKELCQTREEATPTQLSAPHSSTGSYGPLQADKTVSE